jgi:predicted alpha-1,2-mannosidase
MPGNGTPSADNKKYGSFFSHKKESAAPGYYKVNLLDDDIDVELTATERVGYHHYHFNQSKNKYLILDLKHRDEVIESSVTIEDSVTITGMRRSKAWADNQYVFFVMKLSHPFSEKVILNNDEPILSIVTGLDNSKNCKAFFKFDQLESNDLWVKVAISPVSIEGAKLNLASETNQKSFSEIKKEATEKWEQELSKIEVKSKDENKLAVFYTSLYHTAIVPNINMDVDGKYRGRDNQIHTATDFTYFSVFSLWDTYRAAHPLYTIIDTKRTLDYIKTFLVQYQQGGRLPVWELSSCETDCMIGYHSVPVITDAYMKGIRDFDTTLALQAMEKSANWNHLGLPAFIYKGVISSDDEHESVSKTLEYAYDDYCIAMMAREMGAEAIYSKYIKRAQYYKNIFNTQSGFATPIKNGDWLHPFDPREVNNHFTEANSWQYSFYFPQDINGYIESIGGKKNLEKKLDALFSENSQTTGRDQSDITGLIGQYAHGNEPSHHIIYLYDYTNNPFKAQELSSKVMNEFYKNEPDGLIGNEDCGQMSAWYVMSALGFYPVTPGSNKYLIGSPQFALAEIHLENGKSFVVNAPGAEGGSKYIQSAYLSTTKSIKPTLLETPSISHEAIAGGGLVSFMMGNNPSNCFRVTMNDSVLNKMQDAELVVNPVINGGGISFIKNKKIKITSSQKSVKLFYTLDGTTPDENSIEYSRPFTIDSSIVVKAISIDKNGQKSFVATAYYKKMKHNWDVTLHSKYEPQYDGGGTAGLIDGIEGTTNWRMGNWQGYQLQNVDAVLDLKTSKNISKVSIGFLQDTRAWIVMPKKVMVFTSMDGKNFEQAFVVENILAIEDLVPQKRKVIALMKNQTARYIKIVAEQYGKLPAWHEGAGGDTHIFIDEVEVD